jgi:hypothetical protein
LGDAEANTTVAAGDDSHSAGKVKDAHEFFLRKSVSIFV